MSRGTVRAALNDLGISTPGLRTVPVEGVPEVVLAFDVEPASWFTVWQSLRDEVNQLKLWPLATCTWGAPFDEITRREMQGPDGLDASPSAIIARVPEVDVDRLLDAERARQNEGWLPDDADLGWMIDCSVIDGVDIAQLHRELGSSPDLLEVERWLLDLELDRGVPDDPEHDDSYLSWYEPEDVVMLLFPTTNSWESGAYVGGYVWGQPHTDLRTALLRRWRKRHGAELAANWGTMLQLVVRNPPTSIEEAWTVAYESSLIWRDTACSANGVPTRRHARDLVGRRDWFLQHRP